MWTTPDVPCKYCFNKYFFPILKNKSKVSKARHKLSAGFNGWPVTNKKCKWKLTAAFSNNHIKLKNNRTGFFVLSMAELFYIFLLSSFANTVKM